ncbi:MAG: hypothetical protein HC887_00075 [Desulfobacteraceae bacterium]|nr:hypothetical protein [Desulfobacteraceae bacterium]
MNDEALRERKERDMTPKSTDIAASVMEVSECRSFKGMIPLTQQGITGSDMAADNLNCLYEMNEFVRDAMIAMSMVDGMAKEA